MDKSNTIDLSNLNQTIDNGLNYLFSKIIDGHWRGFPTLAGESDIWVTGFIVAHIYKLCDGAEVIKEAQDFLIKSRQPSNGWSYSANVPSDADSTAWCLLALQSSTLLSALDVESAKSFMWHHFVNKGISTYRIESGIGRFISAPSNKAIQGWTSAHPDVSIAAVLADIQHKNVPDILKWLMTLQSSDGIINSYWWRSPYYTTTLLLRALSMRQEILPLKQVKKITQGMINKQLPDGGFGIEDSTIPDAFTTALSLESFLRISEIDSSVEQQLCVNSLLKTQNYDGSWDGDYVLRIPAPFILNPSQVKSWSFEHGGGNSFVKDKDGLFATAMTCYALDCYIRSKSQKMNDVLFKTNLT